MRTGPRSFLALVLPLLFACGSSVQAASSDLQSACEALFAQRVAYGARCNGAPPAAVEEQAYVDSCLGIATAPGSLLVAADITACADELGIAACLGYGDVYPSCTGFGGDLLYPNHDKQGSLPPGEGCFADVQCDSGYCSAYPWGCGVCQRALALGEACGAPSGLCVDANCIDGTCQLPGKKLGEACIDYGGGGCQATLFCKQIDATGIDGTCAPRGEPGASCDNSTTCAEGAICEANVCAALRQDGASCTERYQCASGACGEGKCRPFRFGLVEGEDCSTDICALDFICDDADRRCKLLASVPEGGDCNDYNAPDHHCESGFYCHVDCPSGGGGCSSPGKCEALPGPGQPCTHFATCADGAVCVGFDSTDQTKGKCVKLGAKGEACPCGNSLLCVGEVCMAFGVGVCTGEP